MKSINSLKSTKLFYSFVIMFLSVSILTLNSCKKDEVIIPSVSYLRVINASPTLGTFDVFINSQIANSAPFPFGGATKYVQPLAGTCDLKFNIANDPQTLIARTVNLTADVAYSYYLIDKGASLDGLLITDVMPTLATGKAYVKFVNLSPDAPALSLNIVDGVTIANAKAYKSSSEFVDIDVKTQSFEIKDHATGDLKTTLLDQTLVGGRYYTIIARGLLSPGSKDQAFSAQSFINQ